MAPSESAPEEGGGAETVITAGTQDIGYATG